MLDIKFIRENAEIVKEGARKKHIDFDVVRLIEVDDKRRLVLTSVEKKRAEQNECSKKITVAKPEERAMLIGDMQQLKSELQKEEEDLKEIMKEWQLLMVQVPNVPDISVPEGESDKDNQEIKSWGTPQTFNFTPKNHVDLMQDLDMLDIERGTKVAGFRGYFLKNDGVLLQWALFNMAWKHFIGKGFTPLMAPSLVRREPFIGTGYLPQSEEDLYKTQDNDYLAGTAEVATMGFYSDEVIPKEKFPIKFLAFSPCFRREAGSHGKDIRGVFRVHEFYKLEQVVINEASHAASVALHEELTRNAEEFLELLGLPYRVVVNCGGDLGLGQVKKYDIETWVPSESAYRETHSASYFHDFQTRRLGIRYRDAEGKLAFAHSLNNTALALPRLLEHFVENHQNADGSISIPEALRPYLGKDIITKPNA